MISILKALLISYVISAAALLVLSGLLYWLDIAAAQLQIGVIATYIGFLPDRRILHWQKNEKKRIFVGIDHRRPLLQYSYFSGYCHGRGAAGKNRAGDGAGLLCMGSGMLAVC